MSVPNYINAITLKYFSEPGLILGTYQPFVGMPLEEPCFFIQVINYTQAYIFISYDGINDHDFLFPGGRVTYNFQANSRINSKKALLPRGTTMYVRGTDSGSFGNIYISGFYQKQNA